jgi:hydroxyacylglutathione hydrolase
MPKAKKKDEGALKTLRLTVGALEANCYLLWRTTGPALDQALVFDPGDEADRICEELERRKLAPAAFLVTHCHCDHIGALAGLKTAFPAVPIVAPEAEGAFLGRPTLNLSYFMGGAFKAPDADRLVKPDEEFELAGFKLRAIHCPGHSPGGTAYFVEDPEGGPPHLFCGDIIFAGGIGRGDLPGGEGEVELIANIRQILFKLPQETLVHPGHGGETSLGQEKAFNPFCGEGVDLA